MLASLINIPTGPEEWQEWSFAHANDHRIIRDAIQASKSINLQDWTLDPINPDLFVGWLRNNQQSHTDVNSTLGIPGSDLEDVDISDPGQRESWWESHYQEHFDWHAVLGI